MAECQSQVYVGQFARTQRPEGGSVMDTYVYDPIEERSWGPFDSDEEAETFIASDKYLESWAVIRWGPKGDTYAPSEYHGRWPL